MVTINKTGAYLVNGTEIVLDGRDANAQLTSLLGGKPPEKEQASTQTMAYSIIQAHNTSGDKKRLKLKFDVMTSHDITYVGIIQTARASGLKSFPVPYVLTNCHNSLCAVGGTINEDDHAFGLSAAQKYGGIYVPPHQAVIHQYMREMMARGGSMVLGSDSHTRLGALGTMAVGEGGPELVKQLLGQTYDIDMPKVIAINLTGKPAAGVGPMDVALAIIGAVFDDGIVKNNVMEFIGEGVSNLSAEYRIGIDVMTTETTCISTIWQTDEEIQKFYTLHGRPQDYKAIAPGKVAYYDSIISVDLDKVEPMIAMPFHPSNTYTIKHLKENLHDIIAHIEKRAANQLGDIGAKFTLSDKIVNGNLMVQQGVIVGCAGGLFENLCDAADILKGHTIGTGGFALSIYPTSQPVNLAITRNGVAETFMMAGATVRSAFCGPCFGAGDVPANNTFSVRHATRNYPSREGSKPSDGQISSVALMDARSVAATARNRGVLTSATEFDVNYTNPVYFFDKTIYDTRCYNGVGKPQPEVELQMGPNIADWPKMQPLCEDLLLQVACVITDSVTSTDELIPSGEASSYRSNPIRLAEFTLSRREPDYVPTAKNIQSLEIARLAGKNPLELNKDLNTAFTAIKSSPNFTDKNIADIGIGSLVFAIKPGDGSAREQAASCQKVLGTFANLANDYATKRYRSNLINWGMLPFKCAGVPVQKGDYLFIPAIKTAVENSTTDIAAYVVRDGVLTPLTLTLGQLTQDERDIILAGCLINYYNRAN